MIISQIFFIFMNLVNQKRINIQNITLTAKLLVLFDILLPWSQWLNSSSSTATWIAAATTTTWITVYAAWIAATTTRVHRSTAWVLTTTVLSTSTSVGTTIRCRRRRRRWLLSLTSTIAVAVACARVLTILTADWGQLSSNTLEVVVGRASVRVVQGKLASKFK